MTVTKKTAGAATLAKTAPAPQGSDSTQSGVAAASAFEPSGAPDQVPSIDVDHPAVDNDPRANSTAEMNQIDFNDPSKAAGDVVAEQLGMSKGE